MGRARARPFPPVSGLYGWTGAGFVILALVSHLAAVVFLFLLVVNRDGRFAIPLLICFFLAFPLLGVALILWRAGMNRAGTIRPSSMARENQRQLFGTLAVMNVATLLGVGGFVYLALRLDGTRRFAIGMVPMFLAAIVSYLGMVRLRQLQNRPAPRILGLAPEREAILFIGFSLIGAVLLLLTGLFWIPN